MTTLAGIIRAAIAGLYAYAIAPDEYTPEERREFLAPAGQAIDGAEVVEWLEAWIANHPSVSLWVLARPSGGIVVEVRGDGWAQHFGDGLIEAMAAMKRHEEQP